MGSWLSDRWTAWYSLSGFHCRRTVESGPVSRFSPMLAAESRTLHKEYTKCTTIDSNIVATTYTTYGNGGVLPNGGNHSPRRTESRRWWEHQATKQASVSFLSCGKCRARESSQSRPVTIRTRDVEWNGGRCCKVTASCKKEFRKLFPWNGHNGVADNNNTWQFKSNQPSWSTENKNIPHMTTDK